MQSNDRSVGTSAEEAGPTSCARACAEYERCSAANLEPDVCVCHSDTQRAVLLVNLGTPDSPEVADVRRYLEEFLADPWVIRLPRFMRWFNPVLSRLIAQFRGPKAAETYRSIWWEEGSPLEVISRRQVAGLQKRLPRGWRVYHAMRYGNPGLRDVLDRIASDGITDLVVVPMYAQWSGPTTGTALERLYAELRSLTDQRRGLRLNVSVRAEWYDDAGYVDSMAKRIHRTALEAGLSPENSVLLFSAHSLPQKYVDAGDPYEGHVRRTAELVRERLGWPRERARIGFQSKLGPVPWLKPGTGEALQALAAEGEKNVLCVPLSFTADCIETIDEIGVEYAEEFQAALPGARLVRVEADNDDPAFLDALLGLVRRGAHRVAPGTRPTPLFGPPEERAPLDSLVDRLVAVSVATKRRLSAPVELDAAPAPDDVFTAVKKPQLEAAEMVERVAQRADVDEAFLYNTCQRYELYALAPQGQDLDRVAEALAAEVAGEHAAHAVRRTGREAFWHLLRTAAGMNSRLPGDTDVLDQLAAGRRMAEAAGAAGAGSSRLVEEATRIVEDLRAGTAWGEFSTDYCRAALGPLTQDLELTYARIVAIGGSTTTLSLVELLARDHEVDDDRMTVVYRGATRKRLAKVLKKLAKGAARMVVDRYDDRDVLAAVAQADVLFLGIDRREPVLRRGHVEGLRDFEARPLTVIDFNTHGSTEGLDGVAGVRVVAADQLAGFVDRHADAVTSDRSFAAAQSLVESHLRRVALELEPFDSEQQEVTR